jgi:hypothetical protein
MLTVAKPQFPSIRVEIFSPMLLRQIAKDIHLTGEEFVGYL